MTPAAVAPTDPTWWDTLVANGPGWSFIFAGIAALSAITATVVGALSLVRATRDSRDRSRPVIVAQLDRHPNSDMHIELTIKNVGASLARNLRVTFDPELPQDKSSGWRYGAYFRQMFAKTIHTFGPGQTLSNPWWTHQDVDAPEQCTVSFVYDDDHGRTYTDKAVVDIEPYRALLNIRTNRH